MIDADLSSLSVQPLPPLPGFPLGQFGADKGVPLIETVVVPFGPLDKLFGSEPKLNTTTVLGCCGSFDHDASTFIIASIRMIRTEKS
jgi:hypothetical protein